MVAFSLLHNAERVGFGLSSSLCKDINPIMRTSSKPNYLPKALPPNAIMLGIKASSSSVHNNNSGWRGAHRESSSGIGRCFTRGGN